MSIKEENNEKNYSDTKPSPALQSKVAPNSKMGDALEKLRISSEVSD